MFKQSSYVLALFLGTSSAAQLTNSFATGMNGDEDMGEDITMKGDKFHFVQQMGANGCGKGELMTAGGNCLFQSEALQLNADPAAEPKATATTYPEPEKVHTLDPKIAKAHTTFYNQKQLVQVAPDVRTAFYAQYDKQNGLWRTGDELISTDSQDTPQIHPYNYDPWVYKFSRDAMGPHSQHIDDDPEDSRPKSKEELAGGADAVAKADAAAAEEKKLKDEKTAMKDAAEKEPSAAGAAKEDAAALEKALKSADAKAEIEKVEKKDAKEEEKKAELVQTHYNKFYNEQDGLWMFDTLVGIEADPKKEAEPTKKEATPAEEDQYGAPEKVQDVMPRRYQNSANQNLVNGVNVRRTTFYGQQNEPSLLQIQGEPERSGQTQQYDAYGPTEKVQNLMPRRYERSANSNYVDGVRVSRTTYYAQLEDDVEAPTPGTPTEQVSILEPVAYKNKADTNLPFTRTTFY